MEHSKAGGPACCSACSAHLSPMVLPLAMCYPLAPPLLLLMPSIPGPLTPDTPYPSQRQAVEDLGAGEILLNCIDNDGVGQGFDCELVGAVSGARST